MILSGFSHASDELSEVLTKRKGEGRRAAGGGRRAAGGGGEGVGYDQEPQNMRDAYYRNPNNSTSCPVQEGILADFAVILDDL